MKMNWLTEHTKDLIPMPGTWKGHKVTLLMAITDQEIPGMPEGHAAAIPVAILLGPSDIREVRGPEGSRLVNAEGELVREERENPTGLYL